MKYFASVLATVGLTASFSAFAVTPQTIRISSDELITGLDNHLNELQAQYADYSAAHPELGNIGVEVNWDIDPVTEQTKRVITVPMNTSSLDKISHSLLAGKNKYKKNKPTVKADEYRYDCPQIGDSWGNEYIAARYSGGCNLLATPDFQSANAYLNAAVSLNDTTEIKFLDFTANAATGTEAHVALSALGQEIWASNGRIINEHPSFYRDYTVEGSYPIWGPINVDYELKAGGTVGADIRINVFNDAKIVDTAVRPSTNIDGVANAQVNILDMGGVEAYGSIKIIYVELPTKANVGYDFINNQFNANIQCNYNYNALAGDIGLKLWYSILGQSDEWKYPLYNWEGYTASEVLVNERYPKLITEVVNY